MINQGECSNNQLLWPYWFNYQYVVCKLISDVSLKTLFTSTNGEICYNQHFLSIQNGMLRKINFLRVYGTAYIHSRPKLSQVPILLCPYFAVNLTFSHVFILSSACMALQERSFLSSLWCFELVFSNPHPLF